MTAIRSKLLFPAPSLEDIRRRLFADEPREAACVVLARATATPRGALRFIAFDAMFAERSDYAQQSGNRVELTADFMARAARRAREEKCSLFVTHTHPGAHRVEASDVDRSGEEQWAPAVSHRIAPEHAGRLILGRAVAHAAVLTGPQVISLRVEEVGDRVVIEADGAFGNADAIQQIHDRQVRAFGAAGQRVLRELSVSVVGLGGTGSVVAEQLAHLGVGELILLDPDRIEASNLNRVVGATLRDVGVPKVDVAADFVRRISPTTQVIPSTGDIQDAVQLRALLDTDFFFCCTDSDGSRAVLNQLAYQFLVPGIDLGVAIRSKEGVVTRIVGRVQMLTPSQPCLLCAEVLDSEQVRRDLMTVEQRARDRYIVDEVIPQPAVISLNATASSMAVTMMLSALTGIPLASRYQLLRFESGVVSRATVERAPLCPVCSPYGARCKGDSFSFPGRPREA
jgi:molybdopterin-synthase adenylyltransferase